VTHQ